MIAFGYCYKIKNKKKNVFGNEFNDLQDKTNIFIFYLVTVKKIWKKLFALNIYCCLVVMFAFF